MKVEHPTIVARVLQVREEPSWRGAIRWTISATARQERGRYAMIGKGLIRSLVLCTHVCRRSPYRGMVERVETTFIMLRFAHLRKQERKGWFLNQTSKYPRLLAAFKRGCLFFVSINVGSFKEIFKLGLWKIAFYSLRGPEKRERD